MIAVNLPIEISPLIDVNIDELTRQLTEYAKALIPKLSKRKNSDKFVIDPDTQSIIDSLVVKTDIPVPYDENFKYGCAQIKYSGV